MLQAIALSRMTFLFIFTLCIGFYISYDRYFVDYKSVIWANINFSLAFVYFISVILDKYEGDKHALGSALNNIPWYIHLIISKIITIAYESASVPAEDIVKSYQQLNPEHVGYVLSFTTSILTGFILLFLSIIILPIFLFDCDSHKIKGWLSMLIEQAALTITLLVVCSYALWNIAPIMIELAINFSYLISKDCC